MEKETEKVCYMNANHGSIRTSPSENYGNKAVSSELVLVP